jgi:CheY-like chemotaxis protein
MGNKKILIADDDPDVRQAMDVLLKANRYDTVLAAGALSCMAEALRQKPNLIILDLGLPARDGFDVMERLKTLPSLAVIPIIVVSAHDIRTNQQIAVKAGAKAFLQKPVNNAELLAVIRQALEEPALAEKPTVDVLGSLYIALSSIAFPQSLRDAARENRSQQSRALHTPGKTLTEDDIRSGPPSTDFPGIHARLAVPAGWNAFASPSHSIYLTYPKPEEKPYYYINIEEFYFSYDELERKTVERTMPANATKILETWNEIQLAGLPGIQMTYELTHKTSLNAVAQHRIKIINIIELISCRSYTLTFSTPVSDAATNAPAQELVLSSFSPY